ncbi:nucleoside hydrolase [candidate division KSB1 bacterium]|nr:nucleoside hydrolase [candidate division KSB1 bacterium]
MCTSADDAGALATIHGLQNRGEAELLAVCYNEVHPSGAAAIDAINTWYGRGHIPVGVYKDALPEPGTSKFLDDLAKFPNDLDAESAPNALDVYKSVLANQPDGSVTIVSVGFLNNLDVLLKNAPTLVARKVKELVIISDQNEGGFNMNAHNLTKASHNVFENWPSPIVLHHLGWKIMSGSGLKDTPKENPVRQAYYKHSDSEFKALSSWDQLTVLIGVRGISGFFKENLAIKQTLTDGYAMEIKSGHRFHLETTVPDDAYAAIIEDLMLEAPLKKKKVIFETDMCLDVDDVGALAVLHNLANNDEAEILAVSFNEAHPSGAAAIDAINTWYGRGDIPVGVYKGDLPDPDPSAYLDAVAKFPHDLDAASAPSSLEVYRQVLSNQPDGSVTIISVGFLNNLNDLLKAEPDLVKKKVKELVIMLYLDGDSFQLSRHNLQNTSLNVILNWPTPVVHSPVGPEVMTGISLEKTPVENPVREAYYKFFDNKFEGRSSWDQLAVLYGVRGASGYFNTYTTNIGSLSNGLVWKLKSGQHNYLVEKLTNEQYSKIIEPMMTAAPK